MPTVVTTRNGMAMAVTSDPAASIHSSRVSNGRRGEAGVRRKTSRHPATLSQIPTTTFNIHTRGIDAVTLVCGATYAPPLGSGGTHIVFSQEIQKSANGHVGLTVTASGRK